MSTKQGVFVDKIVFCGIISIKTPDSVDKILKTGIRDTGSYRLFSSSALPDSTSLIISSPKSEFCHANQSRVYRAGLSL